jgi:hypothetical protein
VAQEKIQSLVTKVWKKQLPALVKGKAVQVLQSIDAKKLPEAAKASSFAKLFDRARLIDGESTANVAHVHHMVRSGVLGQDDDG